MLCGIFFPGFQTIFQTYQAAAAKAAAETAVAAMTAAWFSNGLKHKFQTGCRIDRSFRPRANPGLTRPLAPFFSFFLLFFSLGFWTPFGSTLGRFLGSLGTLLGLLFQSFFQ